MNSFVHKTDSELNKIKNKMRIKYKQQDCLGKQRHVYVDSVLNEGGKLYDLFH